MMSYRKTLSVLLYELLVFLAFNAVFASALGVMSNGRYVFFSLFLAVPFFYLYAVRRFAKNFFVFLVFNALPFCALPFIGDTALAVLIGLFLAVMFIYSFRARLYRKDIQGGLYTAVVPVAASFIAVFIGFLSKTPLPQSFFLLNAALAVIAAVILTHITNIDNSLAMLSVTSSVPAAPVLSFNNRAILMFAAMIAIAAGLSPFIRLDYFFRLFGTGIGMLLRYLLSFLRGSDAPEPPPPEEMLDEAAAEGYMQAEEPPWLLALLEQIFYYLMYAVTIAVIIAVLYLAVMIIYRRFYAKRLAPGEVREFAEPEHIAVRDRFIRRMKSIFPAFDKNARIRRLFVKKVKTYIKKGMRLEKDNTAHTIKAKIAKYEDIGELTVMYEKARYS